MTGKQLKLIRKVCNLTQVGLAKELGVKSGNTIARWERDEHPISDFNAKGIVAILKLGFLKRQEDVPISLEAMEQQEGL